MVRKPNQQGRIDHAEAFAYLSFACLKSWRLCAIALALSLEPACLDAPDQMVAGCCLGREPATARRNGPEVLKVRRVSGEKCCRGYYRIGVIVSN